MGKDTEKVRTERKESRIELLLQSPLNPIYT